VINDLVSDQRAHKSAMTLSGKGYHVLLVGRILPESPALSGRSYSTKRMRLLFRKGPIFYFEYNLRLFFLLIFSRVDIFLSNDLDTLPANYFASILRQKPLVYDSHEYFTEVPELVNRPFKKRIWEKIEGIILPRLTSVITVCDSIADIYEKKYGIRVKVVRNIPNCRKTGEFWHQQSEKERIILYQGALNSGRGLSQAIAAMAFIPDAKLWIIGDGDIAGSLKEYTKELELEQRVTFFGRIPFEKLSEYTCQASIGLSIEEPTGLNYFYALPNKLFDYIQANIPVLGANLPEISAIIRKYDIGMILPDHQPATIAGCLQEMLMDTGRMAYWKNNLALASKELCWEKEAEILLGTFDNL
jgi:glycosyltransferase involved in cell wall biosynthesis